MNGAPEVSRRARLTFVSRDACDSPLAGPLDVVRFWLGRSAEPDPGQPSEGRLSRAYLRLSTLS
jgi:hypothetical protein